MMKDEDASSFILAGLALPISTNENLVVRWSYIPSQKKLAKVYRPTYILTQG